MKLKSDLILDGHHPTSSDGLAGGLLYVGPQTKLIENLNYNLPIPVLIARIRPMPIIVSQKQVRFLFSGGELSFGT